MRPSQLTPLAAPAIPAGTTASFATNPVSTNTASSAAIDRDLDVHGNRSVRHDAKHLRVQHHGDRCQPHNRHANVETDASTYWEGRGERGCVRDADADGDRDQYTDAHRNEYSDGDCD